MPGGGDTTADSRLHDWQGNCSIDPRAALVVREGDVQIFCFYSGFHNLLRDLNKVDFKKW